MSKRFYFFYHLTLVAFTIIGLGFGIHYVILTHDQTIVKPHIKYEMMISILILIGVLVGYIILSIIDKIYEEKNG